MSYIFIFHTIIYIECGHGVLHDRSKNGREGYCLGSKSRVMARTSSMWVILGILFLSSTLRSEVTRPSSRILHTETPEFQQIRAEGFDALYNMDYTLARSRFARLRQILPQHPSGYLYAATATWVELLNSRRRLQTGIYKGQSFFVESKEKVDLRTDEVFRAAIAQAICTADSALPPPPPE